jgi:hypothetical protein
MTIIVANGELKKAVAHQVRSTTDTKRREAAGDRNGLKKE